MLLKASTARNRSFLLVQSADHLTGLTGATPTVTLSKDGGAFAAAGGVITEIANGWYKIALTTTDTNTKGDLLYHVTAASGDATDFADQVVTDLPGDSIATNNDKTGYSLAVAPPTVAAIATAVWQDTTAGDFTVASSIGKSLYTTGNPPGGASGLALVGSNMGTVTSVSGAVGSVTARVTANTDQLAGAAVALDANNLLKVDVEDWKSTALPAQATAGVPDVNVKNINNVAAATPGAADGVLIAGANAATTFSDGVSIQRSTLNGVGLDVAGNGSGAGLRVTGGATGPGAKVVGGATSGDGLDISTTSGDGVSILPTAGSAIVATGNGTSKHGIVATGGTAGTSDGVKAVAGVGGVDLRANITGNVSGNVSGSVASVAGAVGSVTARVTANTDQFAGQPVALDANNLPKVDVEDWKGAAAPAMTGDAFARLGAPAGASVAADVAAVAGNVWTVGTRSLTGNQGIKKNAALPGFMFLMTDATTHAPKTGLTVAPTVSLDGGAFSATVNAVTEVGSGWYKLTLAAADTNGNVVALRFTAAGADDRNISFATSS